jgi:PIN domain nuclease of toxin-antitoxin system
LPVDLLLDTHAALWWAQDPSQLSKEAVEAIADPTRIVWFTAASAWELSIKVRAGKLRVDVARLVEGLTSRGIRLLGIGIDDAIAAGSLDWDHRDPFDRMIVAQAARNNLALVTRDMAIRGYVGVQTIGA